jgi:hypothetical protein
MATHLYLSMFPESLVASMLQPEEFGPYLAVGTQKRSRGPAIFFEVTGRLPPGAFDLGDVERRCVPHPNGEPKHSVYLAIYRVLERVPMEALGDLFLVTEDGRVLRRSATGQLPAFSQRYYYYQELGPVYPRIVSSLAPREFSAFITDAKNRLQVPRLLFADLRLGELAENPEHGNIRDLPYSHVEHLRDCLTQLRAGAEKQTKTVDRMPSLDFPWRTVEHGFFLAEAGGMRYYPFPSWQELQTDYYEWWRSAST